MPYYTHSDRSKHTKIPWVRKNTNMTSLHYSFTGPGDLRVQGTSGSRGPQGPGGLRVYKNFTALVKTLFAVK